MVPILLLVALNLNFFRPVTALAECSADGPGGVAETRRALMRLNRRYDDFKKKRAEEEARAQIRDHGRHHLHAQGREHEINMERARLEFIRRRKPPIGRDAELERDEDLRRKKRDHAMNAARACFVREHDRQEAQARHGRAVPENQEYELED